MTIATCRVAKKPNPRLYPSTISARVTGVASSRSSVPPILSRRKLMPVRMKTKK